MFSEFEKCGTWWELSPLHKCLRWLHYVPRAYIKAILRVLPTWRANRDELSLGVSFQLLVALGTTKLDNFYRLKKGANL